SWPWEENSSVNHGYWHPGLAVSGSGQKRRSSSNLPLSFPAIPPSLPPHAPLLAPPQQSNLSRHRAWGFTHSCQDASCLSSWGNLPIPRTPIVTRHIHFDHSLFHHPVGPYCLRPLGISALEHDVIAGSPRVYLKRP